MDQKIIQLQNYLKNLEPQKLDLKNINEITVKEMNRGGYNINYLLTADSHKFVFRLNTDKYLDVENQIQYEYEILKNLENKNIAPKVYFADTTKENLEFDVLVEEFIDNKPLIFNNQFLKDFAELIKKLHSLPLPDNKLLIRNKKPLLDQWQFIKNKIDFIKASNYHQRFLNFFNHYLPKVNDYVLKYTNLFTTEDICLNHRDLVIENVLQTDKGLRLIDWQAVMADDPSYDLAFFICDIMIEWNLNRSLTAKEKQIFLKSYKVDDNLLNKINIRQPLVYLEIFVWLSYRATYLRDKLNKNLIENNDRKFVQKRIIAYENFLEENKMKKYLKNF
ncbi:phosphotransferase [Patescibacteria group bacterium]|nr:phosphotransferase [Patescibacteria group bacterium]